MALQLGAVRDAFRAAKVPDELANRASEELAGYADRLARIDTRLTLLGWMVTTNVGLTVLLLGSMLALWARLGEIGGQVAQIARTVH
ncbi:integrase [Rhodopila globiformis]|nr:integrase [Rhodopila globiformis]